MKLLSTKKQIKIWTIINNHYISQIKRKTRINKINNKMRKKNKTKKINNKRIKTILENC